MILHICQNWQIYKYVTILTKFNAVKIALQIYLVDGILPFHAIYHQKFMSALVRFLATKPRRVYLFPVVIEYKKKFSQKRELQ